MDFPALAKKLKTPHQIQKLIHSFKYNFETTGATQKSAWMTLQSKVAHCMEGALVAAAIMEHLNFPPLLLSFESSDKLDHIVYLFKLKQKWGAIGKSRDLGLAGRNPQFRSVRDLAWSYVDPYVDLTGRIKAYQVIDISAIKYDWRYGKRNLWAFEKFLIDFPHRPLKASNKRHHRIRNRMLNSGKLPPENYWW